MLYIAYRQATEGLAIEPMEDAGGGAKAVTGNALVPPDSEPEPVPRD